MIEQRVTLRYGAQQIPAIVQAVQGDTGRDVIFELADYEIPAGATANYYIDKSDDTAIYNSAEVISSTEIRAHLTEQALAVPGRNNGQVRILSDDEVITSFDFVLEVEAFRGLMRMQSETEVNIFDQALQAAAEDAIEEIQAQTPVVTGMQNSIASTYSASNKYAVGDYVMYNAQLYKCNTAITTAEAWTAAHWTQVPLANDVKKDYRTHLYDVIDVLGYGEPPASYTGKGITATRLKEDTWHFAGTISGSDFFAYYQNVNVLPFWLEKGKTYYLMVSGATATNSVYFEVLGFRNGSTQVSLSGRQKLDGVYEFTIPSDFEGGAYVRIGWLNSDSGTVVDETITYHIYTAPLSGNDAAIKAYNSLEIYADSYDDMPTSCDDINENIVYFVPSSAGVPYIADFPLVDAGWIQTIVRGAFKLQIAYPYNPHTKYTMIRRGNGSSYTDWVNLGENIDISSILQNIGNLNYSSCDDAEANKIGFVSSNAGILAIPDFPINGAGWLVTIGTTNAANNLQIAFPFHDDKEIKYRTCQFGVWGVWKSIGGGGQTITIVQEVSRDTYNNTYNIDTTPTITTDTNGWLQPVDTNTEDETGKTDMTGAIMSMLNDTGYCHLAPGIYYVSGNIDMPADSVIEGCGKKTIIRLLQSVESGYIVRMHTRSTLKNVCLSGGYAAGDISDGNIGGRKGINYIGNRDGMNPDVTPRTCTCCIIDGCFFENLDSGFYGYNAGGGLQEGVEMSNCYFTRCKAGINIDYWTEYCKFTNCIIFQCYYACINNGGNNVFTACTFHGVIGFLIDNSSGEKSNNAHGTVIGCTFNHIDNMNNPGQLGKGIAIKVLNITAGFIFANCQLWYGRIHIEDAKGVQITGCELGGLGNAEYPVIETSGNGMVFVDNCLFQTRPNLSLAAPMKFTNCWTYDGLAVTG